MVSASDIVLAELKSQISPNFGQFLQDYFHITNICLKVKSKLQ